MAGTTYERSRALWFTCCLRHRKCIELRIIPKLALYTLCAMTKHFCIKKNPGISSIIMWDHLVSNKGVWNNCFIKFFNRLKRSQICGAVFRLLSWMRVVWKTGERIVFEKYSLPNLLKKSFISSMDSKTIDVMPEDRKPWCHALLTPTDQLLTSNSWFFYITALLHDTVSKIT